VLVNALFAEFGLLVLIPDHPKLKAAYSSVIRRELLEQFSSGIVAQTIDRLKEHYKVQAAGREINLFYLFDDGRRERIEKTASGYRVLFSDLNFTEQTILQELETHPERFSPNVILRGMFQETILPNIAFIGGGGELAYWLELRNLFHEAGVPYPVLVLRNSFLLVNERAKKLQQKLGLTVEELFKPTLELEDLLVERLHGKIRDTEAAKAALEIIYDALKLEAAGVDSTLVAHVGALHARARNGLDALAKKMQRAERRKISEESAQLETMKNLLFPKGSLQERLDNFMPLYAQYGPGLLHRLYNESLALEQQFTVSYIDQ
jgi:bacillithiol biosynthesis cysteine-adding enzyme BshC